MAELLRVPVPVNYQLSRASGPEQSSLALLASVQVPLTQVRSAHSVASSLCRAPLQVTDSCLMCSQGSSATKQRAAATGNTGLHAHSHAHARTHLCVCSYLTVCLQVSGWTSASRAAPPPGLRAAATARCCWETESALSGSSSRLDASEETVSDLTVDRKSPSVCVLQEGQPGPGASLLFCSPNCSTLYTSDLQSRSAGTKVRPRPHRRCHSRHWLMC